MESIYKEKLIKEIETIPEDKLPIFYKIINLLKHELDSEKKKMSSNVSLAGIWLGSKINDDLFIEAKNSLFPYELEK